MKIFKPFWEKKKQKAINRLRNSLIGQVRWTNQKIEALQILLAGIGGCGVLVDDAIASPLQEISEK